MLIIDALVQIPTVVIYALKRTLASVTDSSTPLLPFVPKSSESRRTELVWQAMTDSDPSQTIRAHLAHLTITLIPLRMASSSVEAASDRLLQCLDQRTQKVPPEF